MVSRAHGRSNAQRSKEEPSLRDEETTADLSSKAVEVARAFGGKLEIIPLVPIQCLQDFSYLYTPGVAQVSLEIAKDPEKSFELTGRWNTVGIVTDGSRVLGLGNVGPSASLPVMEGKALLFKYLGGVNAFPLPIEVQTGDEIVETVKRLEPALGGVNLEDIASPKCFGVMAALQKALTIPVWHDDQLGTAAASIAGLLNAMELTGRTIAHAAIVLLGAGAANIATAHLLKTAGADMGAITMVDHRGILHSEREDMEKLRIQNRWKYDLALTTNDGGKVGGLKEALEGADVLLGASTLDPHTAKAVKPEFLRSMAPKPIIFALANPIPEVWPAVAKKAGAAIVATGRSDFPNQVNNSLVFPSVFRGVLDARAKGISEEIVMAAARELARGARLKGLTPEHILPTMEEEEAFSAIAVAVALKTEEVGLARVKRSRAEYERSAKSMLARERKITKMFMEAGLYSCPLPGLKG